MKPSVKIAIIGSLATIIAALIKTWHLTPGTQDGNPSRARSSSVVGTNTMSLANAFGDGAAHSFQQQIFASNININFPGQPELRPKVTRSKDEIEARNLEATADLERRQRKYGESEVLLKKALVIWEKLRRVNEAQAITDALTDVLKRQDKIAEASILREEFEQWSKTVEVP
jgi:hypothetical protein